MEIRTIRGVFMIWIGKTGIYEIRRPLFLWNVVLYRMPWILVNSCFLKLCFWCIKNCKFQRNVLMQMKRRRKLFKNFEKKKMKLKIFLQLFLVISRLFFRICWKTVLIRKIVLFLGFKKPYYLEIRTSRNRTNRGLPVPYLRK